MPSLLINKLEALNRRLNSCLLRASIQSAPQSFDPESIDSIYAVTFSYLDTHRKGAYVKKQERGVEINLIDGVTFDFDEYRHLKSYTVCLVSPSKPARAVFQDYYGTYDRIPASPGRFTLFDKSGSRFNLDQFSDYSGLISLLEKYFPPLLLKNLQAYRTSKTQKKRDEENKYNAMIQEKIKQARKLGFNLDETRYVSGDPLDPFFEWFNLFHFKEIDSLRKNDDGAGTEIFKKDGSGPNTFYLKHGNHFISITTNHGVLVQDRRCHVDISIVGGKGNEIKTYYFDTAKDLEIKLLQSIRMLNN